MNLQVLASENWQRTGSALNREIDMLDRTLRITTNVVLTFVLTTEAIATEIYRSATWLMTGACDSTDQVYKWKVEGNTAPGTWNVPPWLTEPIIIRGIELTKFDGGPTIWWMAGNDTISDTMMFLGPGENHGSHDFPAGMGMPMPAASAAEPKDYIDLHGACSGGSTVHVFYTVYYTIQSEVITSKP